MWTENFLEPHWYEYVVINQKIMTVKTHDTLVLEAPLASVYSILN